MTSALSNYAAEYKRRIDSGEEKLPREATEGPFALGAVIMVSRDCIGATIRNPDLPQWFPALVRFPPANEPGNWYRWYDPYIWFETELDLTNGGGWCTANRNTGYVGKTYYERDDGRLNNYDGTPYWAYPLDVWKRLIGDTN